jgi:hypothetical protein
VIHVTKSSRLGYGFVEDRYLRDGEDEYFMRFLQNGGNDMYRHLRDYEIEILIREANHCDDWSQVLVQDPFDPNVIKRSNFHGLVRLGAFCSQVLGFHDFVQAEGILSSTIISSDIGSHCSIAHCPFIADYIIKDHCILSRIDELQTTNHAKFGNGVLKEGEDTDVLVQIDIMNETGGRRISPFEGMTTADAYLWGSYREDPALEAKWRSLTEKICDKRRGHYGVIEHDSVIKGTRIIKDVHVGPCSYIKGANKLKNLSLLGTEESPVQIGEGVEIVNGIIGSGSSVFYGCKAVRFVMGDNCSLKYGARLIHSVLGDNSTVSCCEVLNNLVYPFHEQHHNNSFLIASLVMGQSNMAAGATIGSNHNSRRNDGEMVAGRGFWPALSSTLKHNCRFASFTLLAQGNYPFELFVELPFSLLCDNPSRQRRELMPAYWWMYNMYALERNSFKFKARDRRKAPRQVIETAYLAPDTANEIRKARFLLAIWTAKSYLRSLRSAVMSRDGSENQAVLDFAKVVYSQFPDLSGMETDGAKFLKLISAPSVHAWDGHVCTELQSKLGVLRDIGDWLLLCHPEMTEEFEVFGENIENSQNQVLILKPSDAYFAYESMLMYYGMCEISRFCIERGLSYRDVEKMTHGSDLVEFGNDCDGLYSRSQRFGQIRWENVGGQLIPSLLVTKLLEEVLAEKLDSWGAIHARYSQLNKCYSEQKAMDSCLALFSIFGTDHLSCSEFETARLKALQVRGFIDSQVFITKDKDYRNFFRTITYRSEAEQEAVIGRISDDFFISSSKKDSAEVKRLLESVVY